MTEVPVATGEEKLTPTAKRAIVGAFLGFGIDFYDIYLPTVALAPAIIYFIPKNLPVTTASTINFLVFAATLIGRPIGAFIFGHFGDVLGRQRSARIAIGGFALFTFLIAILPGYATWGYASVGLMIALRLVDGIFMGGEYTSANPLAMEATPKRMRGLVAGFIQAAYPIGYVAIAISVSIILAFLPSTDLNSPYVQWGWRIPFIFGALLAAVFLVAWVRVGESKLWQGEKTEKAPLADLFSGGHLRVLAQVFLMMSGLWFGVEVLTSAAPTILEKILNQSSQGVTNGLIVSNAILAVSFIVMAWLGQRFGRRRMLIISGVWTLVGGFIFYYLMTTSGQGKNSLVVTMVFYTIALVLTIGPWGIVTSYINERFPTVIRASGYGIGYSLAVIIPSFFSFYLLGLAHLMPYVYTPLVLLVIAGLLTAIGAWIGPETRHVDLESIPSSE